MTRVTDSLSIPVRLLALLALLAGAVSAGLAPAGAQEEPEEGEVLEQDSEERRSEREELEADQLVPFRLGPVDSERTLVYEMISDTGEGEEKLGEMELTVRMESNLYQDEKVAVVQRFRDYQLVQEMASYMDPLTLEPERTEATYTYGETEYRLTGDYYFDQIIVSNDSDASSYTNRVTNLDGSLDHASLPWLVTRIDFQKMQRKRYAVINLIPREEAYSTAFTISEETVEFQGEQRPVHLLKVDYGEFTEHYWIGREDPHLLYRFDTPAYSQGDGGASFRLTSAPDPETESEYLR